MSTTVFEEEGEDGHMDDDDILEIDPFAFSSGSSKYRSAPAPSPPPKSHVPATRLPTEEVSQTTKILRDYLKGPDTTVILPTQIIRPSKCECGCTDELSYSDLVQCMSCKSSVHAICYGIEGTASLPSCYTCRSQTLGGILLHNNLTMLMSLRKLYSITETIMPKSISEFHSLLGFGEDESLDITRGVINIGCRMAIIHFEKELSQFKNKFTGTINVDIGGIIVDGEELTEGIQSCVFVSRAKFGRRRAEIMKLLKKNKVTKRILFEDTKSKCLSIDEELNAFGPDYVDTEPLDEIINSSDIENPEDIVGAIGGLHTEASGEIESSVDFNMTKRARSATEESITNTAPDPDTYYDSNPVITAPRRKLCKTSAIVPSSIPQ